MAHIEPTILSMIRNRMNMKKVYIASPYTLGDTATNVRFQMDVFDELVKLGFVPYVPLYSHFQHMIHPITQEEWMKLDFEWVKVCDYLLRLGGESAGADREVTLAEKLGIPVFYSIKELCEFEMKIYNQKHKKT